MAARRPRADVSVLMPVHAGVRPDHLAAALDSVAAQTLRWRELVVVVDGRLDAAHERVLAAAPALRRHDLPQRSGAGVALAAGLARCRSAWVARADADDVNEPQRLEVQLDRLAQDRADVCSAAMAEFGGPLERVYAVRATPLAHADVARRMRTRNPVNHPTVIFRREVAVAAGGYQHLPYLEDYDLWARMLVGGARFTGCAEPLVRFRSDGALARRARPEAVAAERVLQRRLAGYGLVGPVRRRANLVLRTGYLRLPPALRGRAYRHAFLTAAS